MTDLFLKGLQRGATNFVSDATKKTLQQAMRQRQTVRQAASSQAASGELVGAPVLDVNAVLSSVVGLAVQLAPIALLIGLGIVVLRAVDRRLSGGPWGAIPPGCELVCKR